MWHWSGKSRQRGILKVRYDSEFGECFEINPLKRRFSFKTAGGIHYHSRFSPSFQFKRNKDKEQNAQALCLMGAVDGKGTVVSMFGTRQPGTLPHIPPAALPGVTQGYSGGHLQSQWPVTLCTVPAVVVRWWMMGGPHPQAHRPPLLVCFCSTVFWNWGAAMEGGNSYGGEWLWWNPHVFFWAAVWRESFFHTFVDRKDFQDCNYDQVYDP